MDNGITVVGTMRTDRKGIPPGMKDVKNRTVPSTLCTERRFKISTGFLRKHVKGKMNVMVMSSMHKNVLVTKDDRKKPHVITFYERRKVRSTSWT